MGATNPCRKFGLLPCTDAGSGSWCWDRGTPRSATGKEASALPPLREAPPARPDLACLAQHTLSASRPCWMRPSCCTTPLLAHIGNSTSCISASSDRSGTRAPPRRAACSTPRGGSTPYQPMACSACIPPAPAGQWSSWMMEDPAPCSAMRADGTSPDRTILTTHRH